VWRVPENIREENPELPAFVPPGDENPLGKYWLQLSVNGYGIHGTNRPYGIGREVSHGCIRLYPEDIEMLATFVEPGIPVKIINEPVKAGRYNNKVYIEVHRSGEEDRELMNHAVKKLSRKRLLKDIDTPLLIHAVKSATGLPAVISK
jgi:L,D-transpeptidase ErfK/SrfK